MDLHVSPPLCTETVSAMPRVSALARRQATAGLLVTSQRRRVLKLDDPVARFLLLHLDGGRERGSLVRLMEWGIAHGRLDLSVDGKPVEPERLTRVLEAILDQQLRKMAEHALLVG